MTRARRESGPRFVVAGIGANVRGRFATSSRMMRQGDLEHALHLLDGLYRREPGNDSLRRLTAVNVGICTPLYP